MHFATFLPFSSKICPLDKLDLDLWMGDLLNNHVTRLMTLVKAVVKLYHGDSIDNWNNYGQSSRLNYGYNSRTTCVKISSGVLDYRKERTARYFLGTKMQESCKEIIQQKNDNFSSVWISLSLLSEVSISTGTGKLKCRFSKNCFSMWLYDLLEPLHSFNLLPNSCL